MVNLENRVKFLEEAVKEMIGNVNSLYGVTLKLTEVVEDHIKFDVEEAHGKETSID